MNNKLGLINVVAPTRSRVVLGAARCPKIQFNPGDKFVTIEMLSPEGNHIEAFCIENDDLREIVDLICGKREM